MRTYQTKTWGNFSLLFLAAAVFLLPATAGAGALSTTFSYNENNATITGTARAAGPDAPLEISGTLTNTTSEMMMSMDLYLTVRRTSGQEQREKRVYIGYVDQDEHTNFKISAPRSGTIKGFKLDFIYQVGEPLQEITPTYITIKVDWPPAGQATPTSGAAPGK